jgi:MFS family permease
LLYPFVAGVTTFLLLRLFHGFSTGFKPTGTSAYVADLVPDNRRGEAMGMLGFFSSMGTALGPVLGGEIVRHSVDFVFYTSSAFAILSIIILINMKETLQNKQRFSFKLLKIPPKEVLEPKVFKPSTAMLFSVFSFGVVLTITPDLSQYLAIENKGLFFLYFTLASLAVRFISGKASDKFGREPVLVGATLLLTISMVMFGFTNTPLMLMLSSVVFGLGVGSSIPAIYAWTIDLSDPAKRGKAFATMYISLEIGIGIGALLSGFTYANDPANFAISYWMAGDSSFIAFVFVLINHQQRRKRMKIQNASLADLGKPAISARVRGNDSG